MADQSRASTEVETPVNPYSLLESLNGSADTARTVWMIFLSVMAYALIAVAAAMQKDMSLPTLVALPLLQAEIPLVYVSIFAPVFVVFVHLALTMRLAVLARQTLEFDRAVRLLEATDRPTHPLRLELNNFFFVQAVAGPQRSTVVGAVLHGIGWVTLVVLPLALIVAIQVAFLPRHDTGITWTHRLALLVDMLMLIALGMFLFRTETSFFRAFADVVSAYPVRVSLTALALLLVAGFSCFVATIPGEALDGVFNAGAPQRRPQSMRPDRRFDHASALPVIFSAKA